MAGVVGIILAGGKGERLEIGRPKAGAVLGGRTLLARAVDTLSEDCEEVLVCAPEHIELPKSHARRVMDVPGAAGPLAGMVAGLRARPYAQAIVMGVDFPLTRRAALRAMLAQLGSHVAVVPAPNGQLQPLVAVYAPAAAAALSDALTSGTRSAVDAVRALDPFVLDDAAIDLLESGRQNFLNVNTPKDLVEAERRLVVRIQQEGP